MSAEQTVFDLNEIRYGLGSAWRWWTGELATCVPTGLRRLFADNNPVVAIDLGEGEVMLRRFADGGETTLARIPRSGFNAETLKQALASQLSGPKLLRDVFALRIPDDMALERHLQIPASAQRKLAAVLGYEIERQSPVDEKDVYYDYHAQRSGAKELDVTLRIVRRAPVDEAVAMCRAAGIELAAVAFTSDAAPAEGGTFPIDAPAKRLMTMRRRLVPALLALIALLLIGVLAGYYLRNEAAAEELSGRVAIAQSQSSGIVALRREIEGTRARATLLAQRKHGEMLIGLIAEVTRVLPSQSWLTELQVRDGEVRVQGYSNAAASLISLFDASPLFTDAQFRAPLMQGSAPGQERFDLSFKLKGARS